MQLKNNNRIKMSTFWGNFLILFKSYMIINRN